jgi:hypothetical protein
MGFGEYSTVIANNLDDGILGELGRPYVILNLEVIEDSLDSPRGLYSLAVDCEDGTGLDSVVVLNPGPVILLLLTSH